MVAAARPGVQEAGTRVVFLAALPLHHVPVWVRTERLGYL